MSALNLKTAVAKKIPMAKDNSGELWIKKKALDGKGFSV